MGRSYFSRQFDRAFWGEQAYSYALRMKYAGETADAAKIAEALKSVGADLPPAVLELFSKRAAAKAECEWRANSILKGDTVGSEASE